MARLVRICVQVRLAACTADRPRSWLADLLDFLIGLLSPAVPKRPGRGENGRGRRHGYRVGERRQQRGQPVGHSPLLSGPN